MKSKKGPTGGKPERAARKGSGPRSILTGYGLRDFYFRDISKALYARLNWRQPRQEIFEVDFYEHILERSPDHVPALEAVGHLYTRLGQHQKGLAADERLVRLRPGKPVARYNLACSYSLVGRLDEAFEALAEAVRLGYLDFKHLERDPDLAALRADPRFPAFLVGARNCQSE